MKPLRRQRISLSRECCASMVLLCLGGQQATAQLAITEAMSSASFRSGTAIQGPDFWELTNFGAVTNDLVGYQVSDKSNPDALKPLVLPGDHLLIVPGESVLFVRTNSTTLSTVAEFQAWWGPCVQTNVQVRLYGHPGLTSLGDEIHVFDANGLLVDQVAFGKARTGTSFVYDTNSWQFGAFSRLGDRGACQAALVNDIGSPGVTNGPVPLSILKQPSNSVVCAGTFATFSVTVAGLPRPTYQWFFNDAPIEGATASSLTITNALPANEGRYDVQMDNHLHAVHSASATLSVTTNLSAPNIIAPPSDFVAYATEAGRFSVTVCAFPPASYQWLSNGVPIEGETSPFLRIPILPDTPSAEYCVQVENPLGSTNACAHLTVIPKPDLRITEIMDSSFTRCAGHDDWFELTNKGTNAVNIFGYRFSDGFSLTGAQTNTESVIIEPGESVVFAKRTTREAFIGWWGQDNLPPGLKVIIYDGFSLGGLAPELDLWSPAAETVDDKMDTKSWVPNSTGNVYFDCITGPDDPDPLCWKGAPSVVAAAGAFRADECGDIGSPGYTANPPPRLVGLSRDASGVTVKWRAVEGKAYSLGFKDNLAAKNWTELNTYTATNSVQTATDATAGSKMQRFYFVQELP